jgi:hypothetical protein
MKEFRSSDGVHVYRSREVVQGNRSSTGVPGYRDNTRKQEYGHGIGVVHVNRGTGETMW